MNTSSISKNHIYAFLFTFICALLAIVIPWQSKSEFLIDFDTPQSSAFTKEKPSEMKYAGAIINLPGVGNAGRNDYEIEFQVRGAVLDQGGLQPQMFFYVNSVQVDAFQLEVNKSIKTYRLHDQSGNLLLTYQILREQGVKLRYAKLYYLKIKTLASNGFNLPPLGILLKLAVSIMIVFWIPILLECKLKTAWILFIFLLSTVFSSLLLNRLQTVILADLLFLLSIIMLVFSIIAGLSMKYLFKYSFNEDTESKYLRAFLLAIVFFLGFKLLFALHPSLISLDLGYHSRNLIKVLSGDMNLITVYPGDIYKIPYPPLFYILVAPFTLITAKYRILLKIIFAVIEILSPIILGLIARKLFGGMKYAFWAFISYSLIPFSYRCISAGFIAEQFAQLLFMILVLMILNIKEFKIKNDILILILLFALLMSHFGIVIKFYISFLALIILYKIMKKGEIPVKRLIVLLLLATISTYIIFYIHYNDMIIDGIKKVLTNRSPIPDEMQKSLMDSFIAQIKYFGKYFFLPVLIALLGIILYLKKAAHSGILKLGSKSEDSKNARSKTKRKSTSDIVKKSYAIGLWLLLTYCIIFLVWWLTPLKVRHFNFSLIIIALFSAYFIGSLSTNVKRYKVYLSLGLCFQAIYLFVILNRLVFYFYRAFIN